MVNLTFQKIEDHWECEFVAQADFNLHIEKDSDGYLYLQQKYGLEDKYASCRGADFARCDRVIDNDFIGTVYPKMMKLVSEVVPTKATVRYNENIQLDSPPYRALYEAAGAHWNAETGYYELNGLTDITEEEMGKIYSAGKEIIPNSTRNVIGEQEIKTNIVENISNSAYGGGNWLYTFTGANVIKLSLNNSLKYSANANQLSYTFYNCKKLETILTPIMINNIWQPINYVFSNCIMLKDLKLHGLKVSIFFPHSPLLSLESVKWMVDNATNTDAITITVHQDVYNKLVDETNTEWHEVFTTAQGKQISFAVPTA